MRCTAHAFGTSCDIEAAPDRYPTKSADDYTEFEKRYPPSKYVYLRDFGDGSAQIITRFGQETADDARVWQIYHDNVVPDDEETMTGWTDTLDQILIFVSGNDSHSIKCLNLA